VSRNGWIDGEWYQCTVTGFEYVVSPKKETKAFELTCSHPDNGTIVGHWWLTDNRNSKGVPMWEAALERCIKLGCNMDAMKGPEWIAHARANVVGKTVACCVGFEEYQDADGNPQSKATAKFIGIPKGDDSGRAGYPLADASVSPFAAKESAAQEIFSGVPNSSLGIVTDDDVPF
jgi:hypothetical protein